MAKKPTKASSSRAVENVENPDAQITWIASNLLEDDIPSVIKPEKLEEAGLIMGEKAVAVAPEDVQRADWYRPGWVYLYYYPFKVGLTLPFPQLAMDVPDCFAISPGQVMPFAWRVIACLDAIESKHKLGINVDVMKACYVLKKYSGCRYIFTNVNKDEPLLFNIDGVNDCGWKGNYLFAEKSSLAAGSEKFVEFWNSEEPQFVLDEADSTTKAIVDKVMALSVEDMSNPSCLNRPVSNMGSVVFSKAGKSIVKSESTVGGKIQPKSAAHRTRSKKFIPLDVVKPDDEVIQSVSSDTIESPKEKMDVDVGIKKEADMSSSRIFAKEYKPPVIKPVMKSVRDLFSKRARDEKSTESGSSKSVMLASPLTSPLGKKLKFQAPSAPSKSGSSLPLVAHGYTVDKKPTAFAHLLIDSLLPQSIDGHSSKPISEVLDNCAGKSFHALQSALVARERIHELERKLIKVEMEHKSSAERLKASQELASSHLKAKNAIQQEFDEFTEKIQDMEKKVTEAANKAIQQGVMKARVEMMLEYQNDDWTHWDLEESIHIDNEAYPEDAFNVGATNMDEDDPVAESPKSSPKDADKGSHDDEDKTSPSQ